MAGIAQLELYKEKAMSIRKICEDTSMSKSTLCRRLKLKNLKGSNII